ncbi:MFS transporter [Bradyrhizobium sp. Gha]|uniref:MFS transporter n=1 Tax=Bradyrhizobium sp. Gha TaxID=1855318 RepID=UPI0015A52EEC|nr:MFS transporter [Bradyrhizobium sp. Gha]
MSTALRRLQAIQSGAGSELSFVGLLSLAQLISWGALYYTFAVVSVPIERDLGWDKATVNGAWSTGLLITGLAAFPVGMLLDRLGGRIIMTGGTLVGAGCLLLWSSMERLSMLYVVCIGLGIAMSGSLYEAGFTVLTRRFPMSYRDQISRMTLVGGLAPTVFVPISAWFVAWQGWRATLLMLAIFLLAVCLPVHALGLREQSKDLEGKTQSHGAATSTAALKRALLHPSFWALLVTFSIHSTIASVVVFHIMPLLQERGFSELTITFAYSLIGPAQVGSRIALLATGRYFSMETIGIVTVSALPVSLLLLLVIPQIAIAPALVLVLYGTANGLITILRGTAIPDLIGSEGYGSINGTITLVARMGAAAAPIAVAIGWDKFGGYEPIVWILFVLALIGAASYGVAIYAANGMKAEAQSRQR